MPLPKSLTTVTRLSKTLAMILFILFPFAGFYTGIGYQQKLDTFIKKTPESIPLLSSIPPHVLERTYNNSQARFTLDLPDFWMKKQLSSSSASYTSPEGRISLKINLTKGSLGKVDARANPHVNIVQNHKITYFTEWYYGENGELNPPEARGQDILFESNGYLINIFFTKTDSSMLSQKDKDDFMKILNSITFF